ncbi:hypothetical protein L3Y19_gp068 [Gordonia phage Neville]|uniref:Uncharacterized protein n=2 Tax=Nevillevirus TaxID=3044773 RepID=A0A515MH32_9CAUD|nr:hypothetical protein L3Y19_gp068 [Gordonia phage Neville]YP_010246055.1 hypothetical protein L3Y20_gp070 [Gordonia phage Trax]AXQ64437.1 hypothetical protein SEA_NEVILLE_68 [Gordonia phage Neville]QDM55957.1 hypothetical protein SEA_TRAX_70 [Gordonia phage Trax]
MIVTSAMVRAVRNLADQSGMTLRELEDAVPKHWTDYDHVPVGVPFVAPNGGGRSSVIVFVKLSTGTLLNFGSDATDRSITVPASVVSDDSLFVEFRSEAMTFGTKLN